VDVPLRLIAGGGIFDGWRVNTGSQRRAGEDAGTGCHRSVLAPARADGAIRAGQMAAGGLLLTSRRAGPAPKVPSSQYIADDGLVHSFRRRCLGPDRGATGVDVAELMVNCHTAPLNFTKEYWGTAAARLIGYWGFPGSPVLLFMLVGVAE
jgi:hypothetical protein